MKYNKYDKLKISHTVFIIFNAKCKKKKFFYFAILFNLIHFPQKYLNYFFSKASLFKACFQYITKYYKNILTN